MDFILLETIRPKTYVMFFTSIKLKWIKLYFFLVFATIFFSSRAQIVQYGRLEMPIDSDNEFYSLVPLDTAGLVLFRNFTGPKENQLELTRLDTALKVVWKGYLPIPKQFSFAGVK